MKKNLILFLLVVALVLVPFFMPQNKEAEFGGADGQAEEMITQIHPDYEPWFSSLYEPASGEIESLLFTLQGSIGAGVICYILGYYRGRGRNVHAGN
ncbi:energy-coupling factor ABC transporter substrate-binding protein [Neisseria sp. Ec49-e6-T10]|uniref:energy-coupling factor ABC transporter substrate-binding protein n=1 Tax=Neisseria sp. Ec49-e6-T10 TaxID=3140744 RepID=UPI003EBF88E2